MNAIAVQMLLGDPVDVREFRHEPISNKKGPIRRGSNGAAYQQLSEDSMPGSTTGQTELMSKIHPFGEHEEKNPLVMGELVSSEKLLNTCHDPSLQVALWIMEAIA